MVQRFRDSGLAHLTAVSGQNVALLLAAAGPLLARARPFGRWAVSLALIAWFVVLTRAEPSVLRAGMMAALGATAFALGRQRDAVRSLAVAVVVLLLVDPLLAWSVGFWLSVGATAGVTGRRPVAGRRACAGSARWPCRSAVTIGAQVGVAVPSLLVFGRLSLVGTFANLVAVPVAGLVMLYGLPACLLAGAVPAVGAARRGAGRVGRAVGRRRGHRGRRGSSRRRRGRGSAGCCWRSPSSSSSRWVETTSRCDDGGPMTVHLLTGDDESILRAAVSELVHELVGDGDRSLMVDEFDGDDVEVRSVVDAAQTPPFLTERRVVVVRDVGRFTDRRARPARRLPRRSAADAPSWCSSAAAGVWPRR